MIKSLSRFAVKVFVFLLNKRIWVPGIFLIIFDRIIWSDKEYLEQFLTTVRPGILEEIAQKKVVYIFNQAVKSTPAYRQFIKNSKVNYNRIKTIEDFKKIVPETNKSNYIKSFPLEDRCVGGRLPKDGIIFRSAGVAGKPTYWTQALKEEDKFEVFVPFGIDYIIGYKNKNFKILNCWAFGTWPTAIDFTKSARKCGQMVNIGTDIDELIFTLKFLGDKHNYLISGYPPFLRNMIFEGEKQGINWSNYHVDIITGGEGFVEEWRDFLRNKLGRKSIIASSYGSTDKGLAEGFETPLSIILRNIIRINQVYLYDRDHSEKIANDFFGNNSLVPETKDLAKDFIQSITGRNPDIEKRLPMLFQNVPISYYEEQVSKEISPGNIKTELITTVLKTHASQPIIRYNIQDDSGIIGFEKVFSISRKFNYDLKEILIKMGHDYKKILPLPFMYVYGRSDGTVSIDGSNIYPEEIGRLIENFSSIANFVASFRLGVSEDYRLQIDLELNNGVTGKKSIDFISIIEDNLINYSSGYKLLVDNKFKSSKIVINVYLFAQGPFEKSPLINRGAIKYQYIGKKVFGR